MSQQYSYTISSDTRTYDALSGPVSNDLYLLDSLFSTPNYTVIRRESTSGSQVWMTALNMPPTVKGLSVDPSEQNIYVCKYSTQLDIIRLSSSTGALVSAQNFASITSANMGIKVFILSDNSGYYFVASRSTNFLTNFCKFLFSSPSSAQCFEFSFYRLVATNKIRISENQMFLIGYDSASTKDCIFTSVTFGSTTPSWASNISCTSGTCVLTGGDSIMDTNGVIYSAFTYGSTVSYLQIVAQSSSSGVVIGSRYISSFQCGFVYGKIALVDNLLSIASQCTSFRLVLYNTITSQILVSDFSGANLYSSEIDTYSGR